VFRIIASLFLGRKVAGWYATGAKLKMSATLGILTGLSSASGLERYQAYRKERYKLQHIASGVLDNKRLAGCRRTVISPKNTVDIMRNTESGKCNYSGLMSCGLLWVCPVCAARIALQRKQELLTADLDGYHTGLLTLTISHGQHDTLESLLSDLSVMRNKLRSGRWWKKFREDNAFTGAITNTEVTLGGNGWHVHYHMLMIFSELPNFEQLEAQLYYKWEALAKKQGRYTSAAHGVDFRQCEKLDYITKWSIHSELIHGERKQAHQDNISVWEMLRRIGQGEREYEKYFREYAKCFKGKKQLVWGRGLKKLLSVEEVDQDAGEADQDAGEVVELLLRLTYDDWQLIKKYQSRARVLELAEVSGVFGVSAYFAWLATLEGE